MYHLACTLLICSQQIRSPPWEVKEDSEPIKPKLSQPFRRSALAIRYTAGWAKRVARSPDWAKYHGPDTRMTIIMQKATN